MNFAGKGVLVTGGAGFVGSHMVDALVAREAKVTVLDNLSTGFRELVSSSSRVRFIEGDLLDQKTVNTAVEGQEFVFHFGANADVKDGLLHPRRDIEQNILATQNLLEAMRASNVKQIAFTSTGSMYGEPTLIPTPEDCPLPVQTSLYGASKLACEGLLSAYAFGYGFSCWAFRCVSMLGPRYSHGHVIDFCKKLRMDPTQLHVLGDGHQRKSYLHVSDSISGILVAIEKAERTEPYHVFNLGHSEWIEVNDSVRMICEELGVKPKITLAGGVRGWIGDSPRILLDTTRLRSLGWEPRRTIEDAVVDTVRWLKEHPHMFEARR